MGETSELYSWYNIIILKGIFILAFLGLARKDGKSWYEQCVGGARGGGLLTGHNTLRIVLIKSILHNLCLTHTTYFILSMWQKEIYVLMVAA